MSQCSQFHLITFLIVIILKDKIFFVKMIREDNSEVKKTAILKF